VDLTIDFSSVDQDFQGHAMDPVDDVDSVALVVFRYLSQEEVELKLSENTLVQADVGLYVSVDPGDETSVQLSELTLLGNEIGPHQYFEEDYGTFMLYLQKGTTIGVGVMMSQFVAPSADSSETTVSLTSDSTLLEYSVDIASLDPIVLPAGSDVSVDWSDLTTSGLGQDLDLNQVDDLIIARYSDLELTDIEEQFLDIELISDDLWSIDLVGQSSANLGSASSDTGSFPGLDGTSTYILALRCSRCANPAPLYLAPLSLCEEETSN
jgi:hypothetical protein